MFYFRRDDTTTAPTPTAPTPTVPTATAPTAAAATAPTPKKHHVRYTCVCDARGAARTAAEGPCGRENLRQTVQQGQRETISPSPSRTATGHREGQGQELSAEVFQERQECNRSAPARRSAHRQVRARGCT